MALNILADDEEWFNIPHVVRIALRSIAESQQHTAKIVSDSNAAVQKMSKHVAALENKIRSMEADQLAAKLATSLNRPAVNADHSNNNAAVIATFPRASDIVTISGEPMKSLNKKIASLTTSVADIQQRASNHERQLKSAVESFTSVSDQQEDKCKSTDSIIKRLVEEVRTCEARLDKYDQSTHRELRQRLGNVETSLSQLRSSSKSFQALEVEAVKKANARVDSFVRSQSEQIQRLTENVRKLEEAKEKSDSFDQNDYEVHHDGRASKAFILGHYRNSNASGHATTTSSSMRQRSPTPSRPSQQLHMSPNPYAPPPAVTIEDWTRFNSTVSDLRTAVGTLKNDIASRNTDVNDQLKELLIRYESLKQEQLVMKDTVQKIGDSSESVRLQLKAAVRKLAKESNEKIKLIVREEITTVVETKNAAVPKASSQPQEDIGEQEKRREAKLVAAVEQKIKDGVIASLASSFDGLQKDVEKYGRRIIDLEHSNMKIKSNLVKENESTKRHIERIDETLSRQRPQSLRTTEDFERLKANIFGEQQTNLANYEAQIRRLVARINETESQLELLRDGVRQRFDLISKEFEGKLSISGDKVFEVSARMDSLTAACLKQYDELQSSVNSAGVQAKEMTEKVVANFEVRYEEILSLTEAITGGTAEFLHPDNFSVLRKNTADRSARQSSYSRKTPNSSEGYHSVKFVSQRTDSGGGAHRSTSVAESIYTEGDDDTDNERAGRGAESGRLTKGARAARERPPPAAVPKTLLSLAQALTENTELIHSIRADVDDIKIKTVPLLQNEISALGMLTSKCTESMTLLANDFDKSLQKHSRERTEDLRFVDMLESRMGKCEVNVKNLTSSVSSDATTTTCQMHSGASHPLRFTDTDPQAATSPSRFSPNTNKAQNAAISESDCPLCKASRVAVHGTSMNVDTSSSSLQKFTEPFVRDLLELRAKQKEMSDLHSQNLESLRSELSDKMLSIDARLSSEIANLTTKMHHTDAAASAANDLFRQQQQQYALLSSRMENLRNENMLFSSNTSSSTFPSSRHQNPSALNISTADLSSAVADEVKRELENLFYTRDEVDSIMLSQMMTFVGRLNQKADA